jgi:hypothetical protein
MYFCHGWTAPVCVDLPLRGFSITLRHTAFGGTPLDEGSARPRDLCLTQHSPETDIRAPVGFEPAVSATERSHTHALDRSAARREAAAPSTKKPVVF